MMNSSVVFDVGFCEILGIEELLDDLKINEPAQTEAYASFRLFLFRSQFIVAASTL